MIKNQKKAGIVLGYMSEAVKVLTRIFYTPIMLRLLGSSEYGLYDLVNSVVAYLGLLSLGFGSAYLRFYSRAKAKNDDQEIAKLNGMFIIIFSVIALICLVCGGIMVSNVEIIFKSGLTDEEMGKAKILMLIMVINVAITFPNTVFNNSVIANERFVFQKSLVFAQALLSPFLSLPLLIMGYGSIGLVVITTLLTLGMLLLNIFYCFRKIHIKFSFSGLQWSLFTEMFLFTFFLFLNQIIDQINWSVDRYLLGRIINTTAVAVYGIGALLNAMYIEMSKSVSNVYVTQVNRIVAEDNDNEKLTQVFVKVGRMQFVVLALVMTGVTFFGQSFLKMWVGDEFESSYYVALLLMIPETIPLIQNIGIEIQFAKNMHQTRSLVYSLMAIVNILISIPLIRKLGVVGAAIGTAVSLIVCNGLFMNWYYQKKICIDVIRFWKSILSMCKGIVIPFLVGYCILHKINMNGLLRFSVFVILYTAIYLTSMWFLGLNLQEKKQILTIINKLKR